MAAEARPADRRLIDDLLAGGHRFSFFQAVNILLGEGGAPPGTDALPSRETIRFRPAVSLAFPAADVASVARAETGTDAERYDVEVNFAGLYGPASPMPNHLTEDLLWGGSDAEATRAFLDVFHHRLLSFVYRAWLKYRHASQYQRGGSDVMTRRLLALLGLGTPGLAESMRPSAAFLLRYAGSLARRPRSAEGLEGMLAEHFGVPVRVESCVTRVLVIPDDQRCRLGQRSCRLAEDLYLGGRIDDRSGAFRIEIGPVGRETFESLLPGREGHADLVSLTRLYVTDAYEFEMAIRLQADEVPPLALGEERPLGWMSWISPDGSGEGRVVLRTDTRVGAFTESTASREPDGARGEPAATARRME